MPTWFKDLPVPVLALIALVITGVWAAQKLGLTKRNGLSLPLPHKTFADDADRYWSQMRDVVTAPLAKVLESTNAILSDLRDQSIREEARDQAKRDLNK